MGANISEHKTTDPNPVTIPVILEALMQNSSSLSIKDLKNLRLLSQDLNKATREILIERAQPTKKLKSNSQVKSFVKKLQKDPSDLFRNVDIRGSMKTFVKKSALNDALSIMSPFLVNVAITNCTVPWADLTNCLCNLSSLTQLRVIMKTLDLPHRPKLLPNIKRLDIDVRPKSKNYDPQDYLLLTTEIFNSLPNLKNLRIFGKRARSSRLLKFVLEFHNIVTPNIESVVYDKAFNIHGEADLVKLVEHKNILRNLSIFVEVPKSQANIDYMIRLLIELGPRITHLTLSYWEGGLDFIKHLTDLRILGLFAVDLNKAIFKNKILSDREHFRNIFSGLKKLEQIGVSECMGTDRIPHDNPSIFIELV